MKQMILWQFAPIPSYLFACLISLSLMMVVTWTETRSASIASILVLIAGILVFVFLTELPSGRWQQRVLMELLHIIASGLLLILGFVLLAGFAPSKVNFLNLLALRVLSSLAFASHIAVRIFARPSAQWAKMRKQHLLWDITHAQLRLVLLTMLVLFILLIGLNLSNATFSELSASDYIASLLTILISVGGFFGIVTGVLLGIVLIPASLISYLSARRITNRLQDLITVTQAVGKHNTHARVLVQGEDEIAQLQADFNRMMDILEQSHHDLEGERDTVQQLLSTRQQLFADVSHELRTPITIIRSYLEGLNLAHDDVVDDIKVIQAEVLRLQSLVDDVFTLARADIQQLPYTIKPLEMSNLLQHIISVFKQQAWQSKKIDVALSYDPQIPLVAIDEKRLEQILYNLLRNALHHTSPGGLIRLVVSADTEIVSLSVQDTGDGISPSDLPHIWNRFYRSEENRTTNTTGTGLGLALVKEMVEAMNGQVQVSSEPGQGSCFVVIFPRLS